MAITLKYRTLITRDSTQVIDYTNNITTSEGDIDVNATIPASTTQEIDVAFPFAKIKAWYMTTDKNVTVDTNSSGTPIDTFTLVAGTPQFYPGGPIVFHADVTKLFVINGVGAVANIEIFVALDVFP